MHPNQPAAQRQRVLAHVADTDVGGFFDLLTAPQLLDRVEALQPPFRERVNSPTETIHALLVLMAQPRVGRRAGRIEPRALKRRLKSYPLLTKPRKIA